MKKIKLLIVSLILIVSGFSVGINMLNSNVAFAEDFSDVSSYYSVRRADWNDSTASYIENKEGQAFAEGDAFLIGANGGIVVTLGENTDSISYTESLQRVTQKITINNEITFDTQSSTALEGFGIKIMETEKKKLEISIGPKIIPDDPQNETDGPDAFIYGKYTIELSFYYVNDNFESIHLSHKSSFYILKESDYLGSAITYAKLSPNAGNYYSNYSTEELGYLIYNHKSYNLDVVYLYKGLSKTTKLAYANGILNITNFDEMGNLTQTNNINILTENNKTYITFKNFGIYYLTYTPINPGGDNEVLTHFYNNEVKVKTESVHIFGYQLFYTGSDGLEEFKISNSDNPAITDEENKKPWLIDKTKYSADITHIIASNNISKALEIDAKDIAKTNQAPIYFDTNAIIDVSDAGVYSSKYYYFANDAVFDAATELPTTAYSAETKQESYVFNNYSASPLSGTGIYLVELSYSYSGFAEEGTKQYFLFKLTNDAPAIDIYALNEETKTAINNDQYTNKDVHITKSALDVFDSKSVLTVYKDATFTGKYDSGTVVGEDGVTTFTDTARYKVQLTYGSTNKKGFISYFVIDKEPISELKVNKLTQSVGTDYVVADELKGTLTNGAIALSWKEKTSGAKIYAEYKFFPTTYSLSQENSLTSKTLKDFYNSNLYKYSIPSTHILNYEGGTMPLDECINSYGNSSILESQALTKGGLYIFKIYDNTGADPIYKYVFIDKTPSTVLFKDGENYVMSKNDQVTTDNHTIYFGKTKLIKINTPNIEDAWLYDYLTSQNSIEYQGQKYLTIAINRKVYYSVDSTTLTSKNLDSDYGVTIRAFDGSTYNDKQYKFYSICESTNAYSQFNIDSFEYYKENYTGKHTVRFTTDNSRMSVYYISNDGTSELDQLPTVTEAYAKVNHFGPAASNLFNTLYLKYCVKPNEFMTVGKVELKYYAFEKDETNISYTIDKNNPTAIITLYENGELKTGEVVTGELNTYKYAINLESLNNSAERTRAGRYEIIRTYTDDSILNENDPKERRIVFIVDRNGIITEPEYNAKGEAQYFVGSGIQLQIINHSGVGYYATNTLHYYDIYYASKLSQNSLEPVLTTNFLPVTVYIPAYKYGYVSNVDGAPKFIIENNIVKYMNGDTVNAYENPAYYSNYKLSAIVERYDTKNPNTVVKPEDRYVLNTNIATSNFLTTSGSGNSIVAFTKAGFYKVTVTSGAGDTFTFVFNIDYKSPEFNILDTENTPISSVTESINGNNATTYYTNKDVIRVAWQNSPNKYLASINQNKIQYTIGDVTRVLENTTVEKSGENSYYVDINLKNIDTTGIDAYKDGSKINIKLQFNGDEKDYDSKYFSKTVTLVVDLSAPTANISRLIAQTGLSHDDLREYRDGNKFNISKQDGDVRYFAFNVDISSFNLGKNSLIQDPAMAGDYAKLYYTWFSKTGKNTKYIAGNTYETDITISDLAGQTDGIIFGNTPDTFAKLINNASYLNTYVEFIEEDLAGNRTVYTIYLTNMAEQQEKVAFSYTRLNNTAANSGDTTETMLIKNVSENISLYSKRLFNLSSIEFTKNDKIGNLSWQTIKVGKNIYVRSPYTNGKYKLFGSADSKEMDIEDATNLEANENSQSIEIYMVPTYGKITLSVYVLNKSLEAYTMAQVYSDELKEGILIRLPSATENKNNILYATNLLVKSVRNGIATIAAIGGDNAKYLKEEIQATTVLNNLEISYVTYRDARYIQVAVTGVLLANDYFVYTITDNFGEEYKYIHIYGQTQINNPVTGDGTIVESYNQNGALVHYSSQNMNYRFDTTIYSKAKISISLSNNIVDTKYFIIAANEQNQFVVWDINEVSVISKEMYEQYFTLSKSSTVLNIHMKRAEYDFYNGIYGGVRTFVIELSPNKDFELDKLTVNFEIYNQLPSTLAIISKEGGIDVTSILAGATAYSGQVIISYVYQKLAYDYEILLMNPQGEVSILTDGTQISEDGTYVIVINYLGYIEGCSESFAFTIANSERFVYSVVVSDGDGLYRTVEKTGAGYSYITDNSEVTISTHYIVNTENYQIVLNGNLYLEQSVVKSPVQTDGYTYIHKISNLNVNNGLITEYYSTQIAISVILPNESGILKTLVNYGGSTKEDLSEQSLLALKTPSITPYVTTKDEYEAGVKIAWSKYNLIEENIINAEVYYGDVGGTKFVPNIEETNGLNSFTLKTSGTYYIKFVDMAGNIQYFGSYGDNEYFTIKYLSSVIFEVNEEAPINYAIYDKEVIVKVPDITLSYYDVNAKPKIFVELNGKIVEKLDKVSAYEWKFTTPGLYKIWFSAKIAEKAIYEAPIIFTILSPIESRLSYTYSGYSNYYIEDILREGISVKEVLTNVNTGEIYEVNGVYYLKNISLHANDVKTGTGSWTFIVNTNNEFNQTFEFTIWINKAIVPIELSVDNGVKTTDDILVMFNTRNLLNATGDCIVKISNFADLVITKEKLESGEIEELYTITITKAGDYYVEVTTLSGQLLYSQFVIKADPLNTISIIIIVVAVAVATVGIVLFIRLRKRMKIK